MGEPDHYDLAVLREIPLTEICAKLNIELDRNRRACCPFHMEKTPSFHINPKNFYKCFGCGAAGDGIKFVEEYMKVDFKEAIRWLADMKNIQPGTPPGGWRFKAGPITAPSNNQPTPLTRLEKQAQQTMILELERRLAQILTYNIAAPMPCLICSECGRRGWKLSVLRHLSAEGSLGKLIGRDGLAFIYQFGTKARHDLRDSRSCRWIAGKAKDCVWRSGLVNPVHDMVTIFEGETDLISAASSFPDDSWRDRGFIAAPGASWAPDRSMATALGYNRSVHLVFDNDTAGRNATARVGNEFLSVSGCKVYAFDWNKHPGIGDIGDMLQNKGKLFVKNALDHDWVKL